MDVDDVPQKRLKKSEYLTYLATNPHITEEIYKKIVDGCFGLLIEQPCSAKIQDICPAGEDITSDIYSSLISYIVDVISNRESNDIVKSHLEGLGFPNPRVNYFISVLQDKREDIDSVFANQHPSRPNVTDCTWRFDQNISTFVPPRKPRPKYFILVKTNAGGYLRFSCNMNQMHNLHSKVREVVNHVEKLSLS